MNLIQINSLTKRRTKNILQDLIPEYKYQRVTNHGLIILKKRWWSLKKTIVNITDLYIDIFPRKLADRLKEKGHGDGFINLFNNDIYVMMQLKAYKKDYSIVDYVWQKYNVLLREVPIIKTTVSEFVLETTQNRYLPILSPVSTYYIPGVEKLLRRMKKSDSVESLIEKISKIKLRRPQFLVRIGPLQLA
jgi:hypothetical protein